MSDEDKSITALRILRDVLSNFSNLVESVNHTAKRYDLSLSEIKNFNLSKPASLKTLFASLPPEKLGLLIDVAADMDDMKEGMTQFLNYDADQLDGFEKRLKNVMEKFDKVLEDL